MAKREFSISKNWRTRAKVMILRNDKYRTPLTAISGTSSAETENQRKEKYKARMSWTVGQLLL